MHTLRKETKINGQVVEVRTNLSSKDYEVCKLEVKIITVILFFYQNENHRTGMEWN